MNHPLTKLFAGLLLILSIPLVLIVFRKDITQTTEQLRDTYASPNSKYVDWRNGEMHYVEFGSGIPVLFIHGFAGSHLNWERMWQNFPPGYRLIAVDLPGFGLSDETQELEGEPFIDMYCAYITHLLDTLNLDSVYVVGNSMGGYIAWEMAAREPGRIPKLVLVNAGGYDLDKVGKIFIRLSRTKIFDGLFMKGIPYQLSKRASVNSMATIPDDEDVVSFHELMNRKETIRTIAKLGSSNQLADTAKISTIETPTLIIWGAEDEVIDVKDAHRFHRDIRNSALKIYPKIGHVPMLECPEAFLEDLLQFFQTKKAPKGNELIWK